jgi:hypothetical protein
MPFDPELNKNGLILERNAHRRHTQLKVRIVQDHFAFNTAVLFRYMHTHLCLCQLRVQPKLIFRHFLISRCLNSQLFVKLKRYSQLGNQMRQGEFPKAQSILDYMYVCNPGETGVIAQHKPLPSTETHLVRIQKCISSLARKCSGNFASFQKVIIKL